MQNRIVNDNVVQFEDLKWNEAGTGMKHKQALVRFPNGWVASIVIGDLTYGGSEGLYELAVLDRMGHISYDSGITNDVIGHLNEDDVSKILEQIQNLPNAETIND